jgi:hypothetical protein
MKTRTSRISLFLSVGAASLVALGATAQTSEPATTSTSTPTATDATPAKLPYGVEDVLRLSRAQVGEDITLNYIQNSGTIYNLGAKDIVYLRNEGVADKVINAMLDQRKTVPAEVVTQNALQAQVVASTSAQTSGNADVSNPQAAVVYVQSPATCVQPAPVYVEPAPDYVPASTLYVIPYGSSGFSYYRYPSSYYGRSYGYPSTVVSIHGGYFGAGRSYGGARYGGGHRSSVHHFGRR